MDPSEYVLVAILNNKPDFKRARDDHWYRVPVDSAHKWAKNRWPPSWLAFYQTKVFKKEAFSVRYFSKVLSYREVIRPELFPNEAKNVKTPKRYYQLILGDMQRLSKPIPSQRRRRIVFIPTTWQKLMHAAEINDLSDESYLEDRLWAELKGQEISAERQEYIKANGHNYALDFAVYCEKGNLAIETDGDRWHSGRKYIARDNRRNNDLQTDGWKLLRFNGHQINEEMSEYCLPTIVRNIETLGGVDISYLEQGSD